MQDDIQKLKDKRKKININLISLTIPVLILGISWQIQATTTFAAMRDISIIAIGLYAVVHIVGYILASKEEKHRESHLAKTLAAVALGIIIYNNSATVIVYFLLFISVLFFYQAGYLLQLTFIQFKFENKYTWIFFILAALTLAMGVFTLINPATPNALIRAELQTMGILLISLALVNIIALVLNNIGVDFNKLEDKNLNNTKIYEQE